MTQSSLPGLLKQYHLTTKDLDRTAWRLFAHFYYDLSDPTNDTAKAARRWRKLCYARLSDYDWYARILRHEIEGTSTCDEDFPDAIVRYSAVSLIDLLFFVWRSFSVEDSGAERFLDGLDEEINSALVNKFEHLTINIDPSFVQDDKSVEDVELYRMTFFFSEYRSVSEWQRNASETLFGKKYRRSSQTISALEKATTSLLTSPVRFEDCVDTILPWLAGPFDLLGRSLKVDFFRAVIMSELIRRTPGNFCALDELPYRLATTLNIHEFTNLQDLEVLLTTLDDQHCFLSFILKEITYRIRRSQDNDLERRLAFMIMIKDARVNDIVEYLELVSQKELKAAVYLARTCTRTFLEKLYLLMSSLKDVLETRIKICRWLETRVGEYDDTSHEELAALERELSDLDARSDLDSTRVHVDEESLREWFYQTQAPVASRYTQTVLAEGPSAKQRSTLAILSNQKRATQDEDEVSADTEVGSEFLLIAILDALLEAFASDRSFGLDAYLSRRIRHGTLSGQVITPIAKVLKKIPESVNSYRALHNLNDSDEVTVIVDNLLKNIAAHLDYVRREIIQIASESHPTGLIKATWRTATNAAHLDATIARIKGRIQETRGGYEIFDDLYALCWDCLEADLSQLRLHMLRKFLPQALQEMSEAFDLLPNSDQANATTFFAEAHTILEARVHEVCGWFIRPVFRRDSYDLRVLINSTFSIVHELDEGYKFEEKVEMKQEISLSRGSFEVIGDALYVLIGNAAKHGKADGVIAVSAERVGASRLARLSVCSSVRDEDEFVFKSNRVTKALRARNSTDRSSVEEGFSGLGKLAGIIQKIRHGEARLEFLAGSVDNSFKFVLVLPEEITIHRVLS